MGAFRLSQNKAGKYVFRLVGANGQIILSGESFPTRAAAEAAIRDVSESALVEENFERKSASDGTYYFVLKGSNGKVLGKSDGYASQAGRETGIWAVKRNAGEPRVIQQ